MANPMNEKCDCEQYITLSGEAAKYFFNNNEWIIAHIAPHNRKILKCTTCSTKWDFEYTNNGKDFTITKKYRHPEYMLNRVVNLSIWDSEFKIDFEKVKVVRIFDDELAIVELEKEWIFEGAIAKYLFIRNRSSGYLSDVAIEKQLPIDATIIVGESEAIPQITEKDYKMKWFGSMHI